MIVVVIMDPARESLHFLFKTFLIEATHRKGREVEASSFKEIEHNLFFFKPPPLQALQMK